MHVDRPFTEEDSKIKTAVAQVFAQAAEKGVAMETLAAQMSKHPSIVYKYGRPTDNTAFMSLHDLVLLGKITDVTAVMELLCALVGGEYTPGARQEAKPGGLTVATLSVFKDVGELAEAVNKAVADGKLSPDEKREIQKEAVETKLGLDKVIATLDEGAQLRPVEGGRK